MVISFCRITCVVIVGTLFLGALLLKAGVDVQRKVLEVWNKKDLLSEKALIAPCHRKWDNIDHNQLHQPKSKEGLIA
eukprot:275085-Amphidinium_carterae.1